MTYEEFRNLAQGIQATLVAGGLLIAGCWAIYRFQSLLSVKKAAADLAKTNAELEKSKADLQKVQLELQEQPHLSLDVEPYLGGTGESGSLYIRIRLRLSNTGNKAVRIDWQKSTIRASIVEDWTTGGQLRFAAPLEATIASLCGELIGTFQWPGETGAFEALLPIPQHGIYLIEATVECSAEGTLRTAASALGGDPTNAYVFQTPMFFDTRMAASNQDVADEVSTEDA